MFNRVVDPESLEHRHRSPETDPRAGSVGVGIGVVSRQTSTEREVLTCACAHTRQPAVPGCVQLDFLLLDLNLLLLERDVVLKSVRDAVLKRPRPAFLR